MTDYARFGDRYDAHDPTTPRDALDELFPARARRRLSTLTEFAATTQVSPTRWRTTSRFGGEPTDWLACETGRDPLVVEAAVDESVNGAGERLANQASARAALTAANAPASRHESSRAVSRPALRRRTGS